MGIDRRGTGDILIVSASTLTDDPIDVLKQLHRTTGFLDKKDPRLLHLPDFLADTHLAGKEYHRYIPDRRITAQATVYLKSVYARHQKIQYDQVRMHRRYPLQGLPAVRDGSNAVAVLIEEKSQGFPDKFIVISDQNAHPGICFNNHRHVPADIPFWNINETNITYCRSYVNMDKTIFTQSHKNLVKQLIRARKEAGLNQQEAAGKLGRTQSYISKLESGQRRVDVVQLRELAAVYKKKLDFFIE